MEEFDKDDPKRVLGGHQAIHQVSVPLVVRRGHGKTEDELVKCATKARKACFDILDEYAKHIPKMRRLSSKQPAPDAFVQHEALKRRINNVDEQVFRTILWQDDEQLAKRRKTSYDKYGRKAAIKHKPKVQLQP